MRRNNKRISKRKLVYKSVVALAILGCVSMAGCGKPETTRVIEIVPETTVETGNQGSLSQGSPSQGNTDQGNASQNASTVESGVANQGTNSNAENVNPGTNSKLEMSAQGNMKVSGSSDLVNYEFDTYSGVHVVVNSSNIFSQLEMDGSESFVESVFETVYVEGNVTCMYDGQCYYIQDLDRNLLTITK